MPARLRYEGTGFLVPKEVITLKEEQLKRGATQFFAKSPPYTNGLYIIFKWAFILPHDNHKRDITSLH